MNEKLNTQYIVDVFMNLEFDMLRKTYDMRLLRLENLLKYAHTTSANEKFLSELLRLLECADNKIEALEILQEILQLPFAYRTRYYIEILLALKLAKCIDDA